MTVYTILLAVIFALYALKNHFEKRAIRHDLRMILERQIKHELLLLTVCKDDQIKTVLGDSDNDR